MRSLALLSLYFSLCACLCVVRVSVYVMQRFALNRFAAIVAFVFRLGLLGAVYENVHFFLLAFSFAYSLFDVVLLVYHLPRVYFVSTLSQHACMCVISLLLLALTVCALQVSHHTQAYYCKVPHAIFYHAFNTEYTLSFMECDRFD